MTLPIREDWFEVAEVEPGRAHRSPSRPRTRSSWPTPGSWTGRTAICWSTRATGSRRYARSSTASAPIPTKPIVAVATHGHQDHAGGLWEFDERVAHAGDAEDVERPFPLMRGADVWPAVADAMAWEGFPVTDVLVTAVPAPDWDHEVFRPQGSVPTRIVDEGDVIDLGDRAFEVLSLPGHTPGSIGLWDEADGTLFCGDVVYAEDPLIDQAPTSDVQAYLATMRRLRDVPVRIVHAGHDRSMDLPMMLRRCTAYLERRSG